LEVAVGILSGFWPESPAGRDEARKGGIFQALKPASDGDLQRYYGVMTGFLP
jgi:hypothetical protein